MRAFLDRFGVLSVVGIALLFACVVVFSQGGMRGPDEKPTPEQLRDQHEATDRIIERSQKLPLNEAQLLRDAWGSALVIEQTATYRDTKSIGPDKTRGTPDDFHMLSEPR